MRAVVASDCSPSGSTGQVVAMISCPLALSNTPNSVRFTDQPSAHSCSVVKRSRTCPPPDARNSTMSRWPYHPACLAWHWPPCRECAERPQAASSQRTYRDVQGSACLTAAAVGPGPSRTEDCQCISDQACLPLLLSSSSNGPRWLQCCSPYSPVSLGSANRFSAAPPLLESLTKLWRCSRQGVYSSLQTGPASSSLKIHTMLGLRDMECLPYRCIQSRPIARGFWVDLDDRDATRAN